MTGESIGHRRLPTGVTEQGFSVPEELGRGAAGTAGSSELVRRSRDYVGRGMRGRAAGVAIVAAMLLMAALPRFFSLGHPQEVYFDETYYANDAVVYLEGAQAFRDNLDAKFGGTSRASDVVPVGAVPGEISWVHPPLGKWLIATGIAVLGKRPVAWRLAAALFGTALVLLVYAAAWELWNRRSWAFFAATLVASDGLAITMSRIAMLDIFATTLSTAALVVCLRYRRLMASRAEAVSDRAEGSGSDDSGEVPWQEAAETGGSRLDYDGVDEATGWLPSDYRGEVGSRAQFAAGPGDHDRFADSHVPSWKPPRPVLCGVLLGLALACKLNALFFFPLVVGAYLVWALRYRDRSQRALEALPPAVLRAVTYLVLLPLAIYVLSFARFFVENQAGSVLSDPLGTAFEFVRLQTNTAKYHLGVHQQHPYMSSPASWPLMARPIAFWYEDYGDGTRGHILAVGNPVLWWGFLAAAPALLGLILGRRRWQDLVVALGYLAQYLPWFVFSRTAFFYYMLPAVPFMALGLVAVCSALPPRLRVAVMWGTGVASLGVGVAMYPIWAGMRIPERVWDRLILLRSWI